MVHHGQNSIVDSIKLCAKQKNLRKGFSIHNDLLLIDLLEDRYVNSASIGMYMSCGEIMKAQEIFDELPVRHVISWNAWYQVTRGKDEMKELLIVIQEWEMRDSCQTSSLLLAFCKLAVTQHWSEREKKYMRRFERRVYWRKMYDWALLWWICMENVVCLRSLMQFRFQMLSLGQHSFLDMFNMGSIMKH